MKTIFEKTNNADGIGFGECVLGDFLPKEFFIENLSCCNYVISLDNQNVLDIPFLLIFQRSIFQSGEF
mgnify:CR=1 FL=1